MPIHECEVCGDEYVHEPMMVDGVEVCPHCAVDNEVRCARCGQVVLDGGKAIGHLNAASIWCERCARESAGRYDESVVTWDSLGAVDAIGVEIEAYPKSGDYCEDWWARVRREHPAMACWTHTGDGSLRENGIELVSCPVPVKKLKTFFGQFKWLSRELMVDDSCGLHVHANMRPYITNNVDPFDDYAAVVQKLFVGFLKLEELFFATQPVSRRDSRYCRAISQYLPRLNVEAIASMRAADVVRAYYRDERPNEWDGIPRGKHHYTRYCWVNIHAVYCHGTVELRLHTGTANVKKIRVWASIFSKLVRHIMDSDLAYLASADWSAKALDNILSTEEKAYLKSRIEKFNNNRTLDLSVPSGVGQSVSAGAA